MSADGQNKDAPLDAVAFEKLIEQLDEVVAQLEGGELPLEESLKAFERGVRLADAAEKQLDAAEHKVELLLQGGRREPLPAQERKAPGPDDDLPF